MGTRKTRKIETINGIQYYQCSRCEGMFDESHYATNKSEQNNLSYYCRDCTSVLSKIRLEKERTMRPLEMYEKESTKEEAITILNNLGYDISTDISKQFLDRLKSKYGVDLS